MRWYYVRVSEALWQERQPADRYYAFGTMKARADYISIDRQRRAPITAKSTRSVSVRYFWDTQPAARERPEFPVYYDAQGREHATF